MILLEEFERCVPEAFAIYLNEQKVLKMDEAAVLADEFVLTHTAVVGYKPCMEFKGREPPRVLCSQRACYPGSTPSTPSVKSARLWNKSGERVGFYCRKPEHVIADCPVLSRKQTPVRPVALLKTVGTFCTGARKQCNSPRGPRH